MTAAFDPYHKWLGIPAEDQPPHYYRLLGIGLFESDLDVIESAADRQMAHVQRYKTGQHSLPSQQLLNELAAAKVCLLRPEKKAAGSPRITNDGLAHVAKVETLESCHVWSPNITDAGLFHFKERPQIRLLAFHMSQITDAGVQEFKQAMPNCQVMK